MWHFVSVFKLLAFENGVKFSVSGSGVTDYYNVIRTCPVFFRSWIELLRLLVIICYYVSKYFDSSSQC